uniref:Uncharacterized protein n=1 Tax=Anguilla anguilla TaxID=7936 RepID=A0A0E9WIR4_ANGAN
MRIFLLLALNLLYIWVKVLILGFWVNLEYTRGLVQIQPPNYCILKACTVY